MYLIIKKNNHIISLKIDYLSSLGYSFRNLENLLTGFGQSYFIGVDGFDYFKTLDLNISLLFVVIS